MLLHAGRQLRCSKTLLGCCSDSLLSFVFVFLHHHLESWDQDSPRDDPCSELVQHVRIDILVSDSCLTLFVYVTLVERERLLGGFGFSDAIFLILDPTFLLFLADLCIQGLGSGFGNVVGLKRDF